MKTYKIEDVISEKSLSELKTLKLELELKEADLKNKEALKEIFNFDKTDYKL